MDRRDFAGAVLTAAASVGAGSWARAETEGKQGSAISRTGYPVRTVEEAPYTIVGDVPQFEESMNAFGRRRRGEVSVDVSALAEAHGADRGGQGYGRVDHAINQASWTIARSMGHLAYSWEPLRGRRGGRGQPERRQPYSPDDREELTGQVKAAAELFGAADVGVCMVDRRWLYAASGGRSRQRKRVGEDIDKAIVMAVGMDPLWVAQSPTARGAAAGGNGYSKMAFTAACVAELLRGLGWRALPCGNDTALSIPLAIDAGLGQLGRMGLLIHPELGACLRLCKVFTDAPLVADKPIEFHVPEFCSNCGRCADACEVGAISDGEMTAEPACGANNRGVLKWPVMVDRCLAFWRYNGASCLTCIAACPHTPIA